MPQLWEYNTVFFSFLPPVRPALYPSQIGSTQPARMMSFLPSSHFWIAETKVHGQK